MHFPYILGFFSKVVTRKITKSTKFSAIVALLVLMAMGVDQVFADSTFTELHEFNELLVGVGAEIVTVDVNQDISADSSQSMPTDYIVSQIAYLEAFEEVIQDQIL